MIPNGFEPMLASPLKGAMPKFPCLASPKLDGIRMVVFNGTAYSRKLKPLPNAFVQATFGSPLLHGVDGEILAGEATNEEAYRLTMSSVMSQTGQPDVKFNVFDVVDMANRASAFVERFELLKKKVAALPKHLRDRIVIVEQVMINNADELTEYEEKCLNAGYEGAMVRSLTGPYKFGRSTVKEGHLLKVKRFCDSEAEILECLELEHNQNAATKNELGRTKRSSHKAGRVAGGTLGSMRVRDVKTGVEFQVGSGFTDEEKTALWARRKELVGTFIKYSYFPTGNKEKPRFPVYLGPRSPADM